MEWTEVDTYTKVSTSVQFYLFHPWSFYRLMIKLSNVIYINQLLMAQEKLSQDLFIKDLNSLLKHYPQYSTFIHALIKQVQCASQAKEASYLEKLRN